LQKFSPYSDYSLLEKPSEDESSMMSQFLSVPKLNVTMPFGGKDHKSGHSLKQKVTSSVMTDFNIDKENIHPNQQPS
jgi:hypothetical protein